ncbi:uncharacterized protein LOC117645982 [Thrips palmi]|uniref:Uncharacterized protein LOC117645982 n=1 Tax=Thrips palmi TaxID=161013 RepID=A0A6P8YXV5_THRPL|nr:uncharacterized protein LOC117645982 [Thrips palmi]
MRVSKRKKDNEAEATTDTTSDLPETSEIETTKTQSEPKRRSTRLSLKPTVPEEAKQDQVKKETKKSNSRPRLSGSGTVKTQAPSVTTTAEATVEYTSDGMSFEDVTDADDDMLPDIVMDSPTKEKKYSKDDIVWAPHRNVYWPAIVTSVKPPNVCFLYVNDSGEHVFRKQARQLISFDSSLKNLELKNLGEKDGNLDEKEGARFKEAYDLVKKYLMKRKFNSNINARRFLTLNQNDKMAQAKTCLLRLTGSFEGFDDEEDKLDEDMADNVCNSDDEGSGTDELSESKLHTDGRSPNEKAKVKEILRDLETLPSSMTVSSEQYKEMKKEAINLLAVIRSTDCFNHLEQIRNGSIMSSRHQKYFKQELVQGGLGPFTLFEDLTTELLTALDQHCDKFDSPNYKQAVMLPEAIIYAITKVMDCSKLDAKRHFHKTCKKVGVMDQD